MSQLLNNRDVSKYLKRPPRQRERAKLALATSAAWIAYQHAGRLLPQGERKDALVVEIHLKNKQNPNGWSIRIENGKLETSRTISLSFLKLRQQQQKKALRLRSLAREQARAAVALP